MKLVLLIILFFAAPYYTILSIIALACLDHFFPNSSLSVGIGGFELVGFVWTGYKLCIWLDEREKERLRQEQEQRRLEKEQKKCEREQRRRRETTEKAKMEFEQAVMDGGFPSEKVLEILAGCDSDIPVSPKEAVEELLYGACSFRTMTFGDAVRRIQQRQRTENRAKARAARREAGDSEATGPVTQTEAYQLLGVSQGCSPEELASAYHRKVLEWHPDKLETMAQELKDYATRRTARINEAYERLRSPQA